MILQDHGLFDCGMKLYGKNLNVPVISLEPVRNQTGMRIRLISVVGRREDGSLFATRFAQE